MTIATIKISQFQAVNLTNTTNFLCGVSALSGGVDILVPFPLTWNTAGRPVTPPAGTLGYNTSLGQYEYWNGAAWVQFSAGGAGTVNVGAQYQIAYYANTGTAVSGLNTVNSAVLTTSAGGIPIWSTSLPAALTIPQPNIVGITDGSPAAVGSVGETKSSVTVFASSIPLTSTVPIDVATLSLTAGQWMVWGNTFFSTSSAQAAAGATWLSSISATKPDASLVGQGSTPAGLDNLASLAPMQIFDIAVTTTFYISASSTFASGAVSACGGIYALRVR